MRKLGFSALLIMTIFSTFAMAFEGNGKVEKDDHDDRAPIQSGYAVVTSASTAGLVVFETFGFKHGFETTQAGVLPSDLTTDAVVFVNSSGRLSRNLGVAIVNPASTSVNVTLALRDDEGTVLASKTLTVTAGRQTARFVTELFADRPSVPKDLTGSIRITSTGPISVIGLRFRGLNFSTIPITNLTPPATASSSLIVLPHFVAGGGWATEIVVVNTGNVTSTVRVDLFKADGTPLTANLNGQSKSSFTDLNIPAGGVITLSPREKDGSSRF
jgi:hypothetical protein